MMNIKDLSDEELDFLISQKQNTQQKSNLSNLSDAELDYLIAQKQGANQTPITPVAPAKPQPTPFVRGINPPAPVVKNPVQPTVPAPEPVQGIGAGFGRLWNDTKNSVINTAKATPEIAKGVAQAFWDSGKYIAKAGVKNNLKAVTRGMGEGIAEIPQGLYNALVVAPTNSFTGKQTLNPMNYMEDVRANNNWAYGDLGEESRPLRDLVGFATPGVGFLKAGSALNKVTGATKAIQKAEKANQAIKLAKAQGNTTKAIKLAEKTKGIRTQGAIQKGLNEMGYDATTGYVFGNEGDLEQGITNAVAGVGVGLGFKAGGKALKTVGETKPVQDAKVKTLELLDNNPNMAKTVSDIATVLGEEAPSKTGKAYQDLTKSITKDVTKNKEATNVLENLSNLTEEQQQEFAQRVIKGDRKYKYDKALEELGDEPKAEKQESVVKGEVKEPKVDIETWLREQGIEEETPIVWRKPSDTPESSTSHVKNETDINTPKEDLTHVNEPSIESKIKAQMRKLGIEEDTQIVERGSNQKQTKKVTLENVKPIEAPETPISTEKGVSIEKEYEYVRKYKAKADRLQAEITEAERLGQDTKVKRRKLKDATRKYNAKIQELLNDSRVSKALDIEEQQQRDWSEYQTQQEKPVMWSDKVKYEEGSNLEVSNTDAEAPVEVDKSSKYAGDLDADVIEFTDKFRKFSPEDKTKLLTEKLKEKEELSNANKKKGDNKAYDRFVEQLNDNLERLYNQSETKTKRAEDLLGKVKRGELEPEEVIKEVEALTEDLYTREQYLKDSEIISKHYNKPEHKIYTKGNEESASTTLETMLGDKTYDDNGAQAVFKHLSETLKNSKNFGKNSTEYVQKEYNSLVKRISKLETSDKQKKAILDIVNKAVDKWSEQPTHTKINKTLKFKTKKEQLSKDITDLDRLNRIGEGSLKRLEEMDALWDKVDSLKKELDKYRKNYKKQGIDEAVAQETINLYKAQIKEARNIANKASGTKNKEEARLARSNDKAFSLLKISDLRKATEEKGLFSTNEGAHNAVSKHYSVTTKAFKRSLLKREKQIQALEKQLKNTDNDYKYQEIQRKINEIKDSIVDDVDKMESTLLAQTINPDNFEMSSKNADFRYVNGVAKGKKFEGQGVSFNKTGSVAQTAMNKTKEFLAKVRDRYGKHREKTQKLDEYYYHDELDEKGNVISSSKEEFVNVDKVNKRMAELADIDTQIKKFKESKGNLASYKQMDGIKYIEKRLDELKMLRREFGSVPGVEDIEIPDISNLIKKAKRADAKAKLIENEQVNAKQKGNKVLEQKAEIEPKKAKKEKKTSRQIADERSLRVKASKIKENAEKTLKQESNVIHNLSPYEQYKNLKKAWKGTEQEFLDFYGTEQKYVNNIINQRMRKAKAKGEPIEQPKAKSTIKQPKVESAIEQPKAKPVDKTPNTDIETKPIPKKEYASMDTVEGKKQRIEEIERILREENIDAETRKTLSNNRAMLVDMLEEQQNPSSKPKTKNPVEEPKVEETKIEEPKDIIEEEPIPSKKTQPEATSEPVEEPKVKTEESVKAEEETVTDDYEKGFSEWMSQEHRSDMKQWFLDDGMSEAEADSVMRDLYDEYEHKAGRKVLDKEVSEAKTVADQYRAIEKRGSELKNKWGLTTPEQQKQRLKMQDKDGEGSYFKVKGNKDDRNLSQRLKDYFDEVFGKKEGKDVVANEEKIGQYGRKEDWGTKGKFNVEESTKESLVSALDAIRTDEVMTLVKNKFALPFNGRNLQEGYVAVNMKVLANAFFGRFSKEWVKAWQSNNYSMQLKASNGKTDWAQWHSQLGDGIPDMQIPQAVFDMLVSGSEPPEIWFNRYAKGTGNIKLHAMARAKYVMAINDALISNWKKGILTSGTFVYNNRRGNQQALFSKADNPVEYVKATFNAVKSVIKDKRSGKASIPVELLENNLSRAFEMYKQKRIITGQPFIDNALNLLNGHNINVKGLMTKYQVRKGRDLKTEYKHNWKSRTAIGANLCFGLPNRAFHHLSECLMAINSAFEQFERRQGYFIHLEKQRKELIKQTALKIETQAEFLKHIEKHPELNEQIIRNVEDTLGDYNTFSLEERRFIKRLVPFYSWFRTVTRYNYKMAKQDPTRLAIMYLELAKAKERDEDLKEYQRNSIRTGIKNPRTNKELITRGLTKQDYLETVYEMGDIAKNWRDYANGEKAKDASTFGTLHPGIGISYTVGEGKKDFVNPEITSDRYVRVRRYENGVAKYGYKDKKTNEWVIDKEGNIVDEAPLSVRAGYLGKELAGVVFPGTKSGLINNAWNLALDYDKQYDTSVFGYKHDDKIQQKVDEDSEGKPIYKSVTDNKGEVVKRDVSNRLPRKYRALNMLGIGLQNENKLTEYQKQEQKEKKKRLNKKIREQK